jgi:hypothetical protein
MDREYKKPLTDAELIAGVKTYMASKKLVTRGELKKKFNTSLSRLEQLEKQGLLKLPAKLSRSAGATLGRKKSNTMQGWYISRPAPWQQSQPTGK